ncbi:MAG TPA: hypothetical protein PK723_04785 [Candidatus Pacearchaeota archaeon]|nr:hypothetical protein [Candidatus Pacearchaeota archaeon]
MTQKRRDNHSTEFGLWLRNQKEIDSSLGYITTNIDYVWTNYKTNQWMFLEEKRFNRYPYFYQERIFKKIDKLAKIDPDYHGFHIVVFEKTNPEDGKIYIDRNLVSKEEFLRFLQFNSKFSKRR